MEMQLSPFRSNWHAARLRNVALLAALFFFGQLFAIILVARLPPSIITPWPMRNVAVQASHNRTIVVEGPLEDCGATLGYSLRPSAFLGQQPKCWEATVMD